MLVLPLGLATCHSIPDINTQVPGEINVDDPVPSGSIDLFAEDFKLPQFFKANITVDQKLPWGMVGNLDIMYNKTIQNVAYQNLNLKPAVGALSGTPDTRPIYDRSDEVDPTYSRILLGYNTSEGYSYNVTATLTKPFDNGFSGMLAYSFGDAFAVFDGTSSQNSSQWRGLHSVQGRNFDQPLTRSDFSQGSRFIAGLSYGIFWNKGKNVKTTVSIFHESIAGQPYSYIYNDGGRLTNEDSRERELIFIPASQNDIVLVDNGTSPAEQWQILDKFISEDPYLSENRGKYAERNSNRAPWSHVMDLRVLQDFVIHTGKKDHTFQLSLDIYNFTNLLSDSWGRRRTVGSFGNFELLDFQGFQEDTNGDPTTVPTFSLNPSRINEENEPAPFLDDAGIQSSRWQMQIGLRYIFN